MTTNTLRKPKLGQVSIQERPLRAICPSPENEKLYRPVSTRDPEVIALAHSIREHGLREPIIVTTDGYILSGHRRYVACKLAGLTTLRCRVENVHSSDPQFIVLLREYNRQRVKLFDEVVREEVLSMAPEEGHRILIEHRETQSRVKVNAIAIEGTQVRAPITSAKRPFLDRILAYPDEQRDFWPQPWKRQRRGDGAGVCSRHKGNGREERNGTRISKRLQQCSPNRERRLSH
jgi:hypothetical protein